MEANSWWLRAFALTSVGGGLAGIAGNIAGSSSVLALGLAIMAAAGGATFFYDRKNSHIAEGIERAARPSGDNPAP